MKYALFLLACAVASLTFSQTIDYLDHNNNRVALPRSGNFFYDPSGISGFEAPNYSGNQLISSVQFYFMGTDINGTLKGSLGGPSAQGKDVFDGPFSSSTLAELDFYEQWNDKAFQICQEEIDVYTTWWEACESSNQDPNDCANVTVPSNATLERIYNWPAHGDFTAGEEYFLAPFYDHPESTAGLYEPENGDYPIIKGCCATWRIDNDEAEIHTRSNLDRMGIEMRYMTYQYRNFGLLNDVTFIEVEVMNKGTQTFHDFVYGVHADMLTPDIGSGTFLGADSLQNLAYAYYADDLHPTYGANSPVLGIVALDQPLTSVVDDQSNGAPATVWELMHGLRNGQPMVNLQGDTTKFIYEDNPNLVGGWSEEQLSNGDGVTDPRMILSTEHGVFAPGDRVTQTFAFVYVNNGTRLQNVNDMYTAASELHTFYDTIALAQCEDGVLSVAENNALPEVLVYPNPATSHVQIEIDDPETVAVHLVDMRGSIVTSLEGSAFIELDISSIQDGAYMLQIETRAGRLMEKLLIRH